MTDWDTKVLGQDEEPNDPGVRWNPNVAYTPAVREPFSPHHEIIYKAVDKAIKNGWQGWKTQVLGATTIGMEADTMLRDMIRMQKPFEPVFFDHDFAKAFAGNVSDYLTCMALAHDRTKELASWL